MSDLGDAVQYYIYGMIGVAVLVGIIIGVGLFFVVPWIWAHIHISIM
jgi:hypothetical protein